VSYGIQFSGADALATIESFLTLSAVGLGLMVSIGAMFAPALIGAISDLWSQK
jgi:hypothetical protein